MSDLLAVRGAWLSIPLSIAFVAASAGCAESVPGVPPPPDQLHYPVGLAVVPGGAAGTSGDLLVVVSSNFDQRYNAGSLIAFSIDRLFALVPPLVPRSPTDEPNACPVPPSGFVNQFSQGPGSMSAITGRVRIHQLGGELLYVLNGVRRLLFVTSRSRNKITMVEVKDDGTLDCSSAGRTPNDDPTIDCSERYIVPTGSVDPYSLAYSPAQNVIAVGHLRAEQTYLNTIETITGLIDLSRFLARVGLPGMPGNITIDPVTPTSASTATVATRPYVVANGITGVAFKPSRSRVPTSTTPVPLLILGRQPDSRGTVPVFLLEETVGQQSGQPPDVMLPRPVLTSGNIVRNSPQDPALYLSALQVSETRGLTVSCDGTRAYVTLRFPAPGTLGIAFDSAIAVVALDAPNLRLVSILGIGEELSRPFLLERALDPAAGTTRLVAAGEACTSPTSRLLYVPDVRNDRIYILDASTDQLAVAGRIPGHARRTLNGLTFRGHALSAPSQIAFVERGGRTLGFVSSFGNSTLGVIDVTDKNPARHCVAARLGRVLNTDGTTEPP